MKQGGAKQKKHGAREREIVAAARAARDAEAASHKTQNSAKKTAAENKKKVERAAPKSNALKAVQPAKTTQKFSKRAENQAENSKSGHRAFYAANTQKTTAKQKSKEKPAVKAAEKQKRKKEATKRRRYAERQSTERSHSRKQAIKAEKERRKMQAELDFLLENKDEIEKALYIKEVYKRVGIKRRRMFSLIVLMCICFFAMAGLMIRKSAEIIALNFQNAAVKEEINDKEEVIKRKNDKLIASMEMSKVKRDAAERLGMRPPSQSQRVKIRVAAADRTLILSNRFSDEDEYAAYEEGGYNINYPAIREYFGEFAQKLPPPSRNKVIGAPPKKKDGKHDKDSEDSEINEEGEDGENSRDGEDNQAGQDETGLSNAQEESEFADDDEVKEEE